MALPEKKIRGLQNIRTLSGKGNQTLLPHKAYMRIACLEMEKARREEEKSSALARVRNIDARFSDIDVEKEAILASLTQQDKAACSGTPCRKVSPPAQGDTLRQGVPTDESGFTFKY